MFSASSPGSIAMLETPIVSIRVTCATSPCGPKPAWTSPIDRSRMMERSTRDWSAPYLSLRASLPLRGASDYPRSTLRSSTRPAGWLDVMSPPELGNARNAADVGHAAASDTAKHVSVGEPPRRRL